MLDEFRHFVMPVESPVLSDFCTRLTGIEQKKCDDEGAPLQTVLMLFNKWLKSMCTKHSLVLPKTSATNKLGNTALVSWTDWDFGVCLYKEVERKRLQKPSFFDQWIDLRAIYKVYLRILYLSILNRSISHLCYRNGINIVRKTLPMRFCTLTCDLRDVNTPVSMMHEILPS